MSPHSDRLDAFLAMRAAVPRRERPNIQKSSALGAAIADQWNL
jgi:hypothetical protein